jgi:hypothetical protein
MERMSIRFSQTNCATLPAGGRQMTTVVEALIDQELRRRFFEELNASFARLRANPREWAEYWAEFESMEGTLMDGLEDDPWVEE